MAKKHRIPGCLGQLRHRYCRYCSSDCPLTALCVLLFLEYRQRKNYQMPKFEGQFEQDTQ
jgi:hypothetical protein